MGNRLLREAAASVDATPALLPILSELFHGLEALGSSPSLVVSMLREAGIGPQSRVIDLGSGKGAVSVAVAEKLGCRCTGIDAVPGFVLAARDLAQRRGVAKLCTFAVGDVRRASGRFDAAMMLGLFDVPRAAKLMQRRIRPGGVMILDDAVALTHQAPGWLTLDEARRILTRRGNTIARESLWSPSRIRRQEARLFATLERNAKRLSRSHPRLRRSLASFLTRQRHAASVLESELRPVQWLVRVAPA